ncbi:hypothetical protein GE061_003811 [Apolygus lucorum]|uniref:O-acyltransferase WSD1 C-terminal domain-containing protein n=1 Tax=Apolygus lucorum TaxID=248454 RepID=A0A8S9X333_APOLU|nr:hypothetical protein GE061_003811 [Apolygus lucorum]
MADLATAAACVVVLCSSARQHRRVWVVRPYLAKRESRDILEDIRKDETLMTLNKMKLNLTTSSFSQFIIPTSLLHIINQRNQNVLHSSLSPALAETAIKMDIHRRVPVVFRPHLELSEPQNCTELEHMPDYNDVYNSLVYVLCTVAIVLHIKHHSAIGSTFLFGVIASTVSLALTPLLLVICGIFTVYRLFVKKRLQKLPGYMGLMDGSDAYWAGEQIYARSIINILLMVDFSRLAKEGQKPIDVMRETMKRVIEAASYKMKCKRQLSKYGYYYLEKCDIKMNENVRNIEPELRGKADLEKFASEIANEPIISDRLWEVLVGREEVCGSYPVFIRVHHSLGDGYALVRLFLDYMSDKETRVHKFVRADSVIQRLVNGEYKRKAVQVTTSVWNKVVTYIYTSIVLAEQLMAPPDQNSLHNRIYLSGKKVCRLTEIDLEFMKEIRRSLNVRFTDVLLTALSNSLEGCFVKWGETVERIRVVIPARLPVPAEGLTNLFTVAMLELPITGKDKMKTIQVTQEKLKTLPDYYVNYWLLRVAFTIFPATFISKYVVSNQSTLSISNVPGPKEYIKIKGSRVTNMAFFLPNRDTTGIGISFLSYADKFSIGISVDESLLSSPVQADEILEGIVQSINQMHSSFVKQKFAKT